MAPWFPDSSAVQNSFLAWATDFPSGNTSSWTQIQAGKIKNEQKILWTVTIPGSLTQKDLYRDWQLFLKFRYENVSKKINKPDPALVQTSYP
jgi:hypothetical protein